MWHMPSLDLYQDLLSYEIYVYINPINTNWSTKVINVWKQLCVVPATETSMLYPIYKVSILLSYE